MKLCDLEPAWHTWVATRPTVIQRMCERWPPNILYRLEPTGQFVTLRAYDEDGTVRVYVAPELNPTRIFTAGCEVFGIDPERLAPATLDALKSAGVAINDWAGP